MKPPNKRHLRGPGPPSFLPLLLLLLPLCTHQQNGDAAVMFALRSSLTNPPEQWNGTDPCNPKWLYIQCSSNRVTRIQIGKLGLQGTLPPSLSNLTQLTILEVMGNSLGGPLPSLAGLSSLQTLSLHDNKFTYMPPDFFKGMTSLTDVGLDYNPFAAWQIPESLKDATSLKGFSANSANITGSIPDFLNTQNFPSLQSLHLAQNYLEGSLPVSFSGSSIQSLWLNGQNSPSRLNGSILVLGNMTSLSQVWLHSNSFTGALPDFSGLTGLKELSLRDNHLTGLVPDSLVSLMSLTIVNLTNNLLQGPTPNFPPSVMADMNPGSNRFCNDTPGVGCSDNVNVLLEVAGGFYYPQILAMDWVGNDPCSSWKGIQCSGSNITVINFMNMGLTGIISPNFSKIPSLQKLLLANNLIGGTIPDALTTLDSLTELDVSNNRLYGTVPDFRKNVLVKYKGNVDIGKNSSSYPPVGAPGGGSTPGSDGSGEGSGNSGGTGGKSSSTAKIVGLAVAVFCCLGVIGLCVLYCHRKRKRGNKVQNPNMVVIHPHQSDEDGVKITITGSSTNGGSESCTNTSTGPSGIQMVEAGNMMISIQVLRNVTNNFSEANILGRGGFGTVYKGELHDGTKIAVKRMESGLVNEKGLMEFQAEIAVLTKVRHRHLVALLGYCLDGNEKLLVYEYMPQGTLSRYLFSWKEEELKPLEWTRRLILALDVARGVEYLHGLAQQTFIHRDLKPSNILLGDDMRAKVADFGLVRLAPEGKASFATRLAGTFGYLAPEYAVTGRVTTKVDVFSFGVILMEIITGRKAIDESQPEDNMHLVSFFRRMYTNKDTFRDAVDPTIMLNEEILASVTTVAELAVHCTAREPHQRPDMGHAVNVLSSLVELWKPAEANSDDVYAIDFDMTLPQALKKWQAFEESNIDDSSSSLLRSNDNTQTSIPNRPSGFADSFASADAR